MPLMKSIQRVLAFCITLILWAYFLFGYLVLLPVLYIPAYIIAKNSAAALQNINHVHLKCFFALTRFLIRRTIFKIPKEVREIHSSVIVCNHLYFFDPFF